MKKHSYKKLVIFHRSVSLATEIMSAIDEIRPFKLSDQIARACISIPSNIAEGSERSSDKEFARFLEYSSGSAAELITLLTILQNSGRAGRIPVDAWIRESEAVYSMVHAFILKLNEEKTY